MKKLLIIIFIFFCFNALATRGKINLSKGAFTELKVGEIFNGIIRIWPADSEHYNLLLKLEGQFVAQSFFISKMKEIKLSENNKEVIEAHGLFVLVSPIDQTKTYKLNLGKENIEVTIEGFSSEKQAPQVKGFIILDQNLKILKEWGPLWAILLLVAALICFFTFKYFKKRRIQKEKLKKAEQVRQNWLSQMREASDLEHYEIIYLGRNEWQKCLSFNDERFNEFKNKLNQVQFKKEKEPQDHEYVKSSYESFIEDIEQQNGN